MEFLGFVDGIKNVASAWAIASGTGDARATVVADVFHMIRGGGTVDDLLQVAGDRLACFHINDLPAQPDPLTQKDEDRVMVGEGIADLPRVIANLRIDRLSRAAVARAVQPRALGAGPFPGREAGPRPHSRAGRGVTGSSPRAAQREHSGPGSILGQILGVGIGADVLHELGRTLDHHLELAVDGDELPAFAGASQGVGRR